MPRPRLAAAFRATAATAAALLLAGLTPAAASAAQPAPPVPNLTWQQPCAAGFQCDTAPVPLDYRAPHGPSIRLALIRRPADDQVHRIGTLFYNPGGPGVPGTMALPAVLDRFPEQVRRRFDIVSFDPRGIGASTTLNCFPDAAAEQALLGGLPAGYPVGAEQQSRWADTYAQLGRRCAGNDRTGLLAHLSTADVARDLDLLRQAVGDRRLSYLGTSYGTYLGATYANLFPGRVRAMVLDSAIDPAAWSTGRTPQDRALPPFLRAGSDLASARALNTFLDRCGAAGPAACAFSAGGPEATRAKFAALTERLDRGPITVGTGAQAVTYDQASAASTIAVLLYAVAPVPGAPGTGWPGLGEQLQRLWTAPDTPAAPLPVGGPPNQPQVLGVLCADTVDPPAGADYPALADLARARSGAAGPYWVWQTERCAQWPAEAARDRYDGPWDRPTAAPVLVVANTGDPVWPYEGSRALADTLDRGRLLTVDGGGHTVLGNPSGCAAGHEERYLVDGLLPPRGEVCAPDRQPFE
ncbi:alpha/beta hydrolase [Kitasatospora sp. SUK 42]|uniref:alpha/beta hydrolase n=1 Tax=Kitasatospora sp. SUK 42 TaxID=1588882 RepID=UPI0018C8DB16|nr:alpha/beta hydrolase [Kitasatospora sp. SUK 42]MBV2155373.1 alpha/beta hydrolase [Kitasatospora sp. SUK 42]